MEGEKERGRERQGERDRERVRHGETQRKGERDRRRETQRKVEKEREVESSTNRFILDSGAGDTEVQLAVLLNTSLDQRLDRALLLEQQEGVA